MIYFTLKNFDLWKSKKIDFFQIGFNAQSTDVGRVILHALEMEENRPPIIGLVGGTEEQKKALKEKLNAVEVEVVDSENYPKEDNLSEKIDKSFTDFISTMKGIEYNSYSVPPVKNRDGSKVGYHNKSVTKRRSKKKQARKARKKNRK